MGITHEYTEQGRFLTGLIKTASIGGLSVGRGHGSNNIVTATNTARGNLYGGWQSNLFYEPVMIGQLPSSLPRGAVVVDAGMDVYWTRNAFPSNTVPSGAKFTIYPIRPALSSTLAAIDWTHPSSGVPWDQYGANLSPGFDLDEAIAELAIPSSIGALIANDENQPKLLGSFKFRDYVEQQLKVLDPIQLMYVASWGNPAASSYVALDNPSDATQDDLPHTGWWVKWKYSTSVYLAQATGDRRANRGQMMSARVGSASAHMLRGKSVSRGSSSNITDDKYWAINESDGPKPANVIDSGAVKIGSVVTSGAPSGAKVHGFRGFNNGTGTISKTGTWTITMSSATVGTITFTEESTAIVTTWAAHDFTSDATLDIAGDDILFVPGQTTTDSVAWNGTAASGDVFTFDMRADVSDSTYRLAGLNRVSLVPATGDGRTTPDTAHARPAITATTEQGYLDDNVIANSSGSTATCATVSDGGSWTHWKYMHGNFTAGCWATLCNTATPQRQATVWIQNVYPIDHAEYAGQLRLTETPDVADAISSPGDFDSQSYLTSGLPLSGINGLDQTVPEFLRSYQAFLAVATSASSPMLELSEELPLSNGSTIGLFDLDNPASAGTYVVDNANGVDVELSANVGAVYPAGTLVFIDDDGSSAPFFVLAAPETGDVLGRVLGLLSIEETALV